MSAETHITTLMNGWLLNRSANTALSYRATVEKFLGYADKPLAAITLADVQTFAASLTHLSMSSQGQRLAAVKSFLRYAHRAGAIERDPGTLVRLPPKRETLAARILSETQVRRLIADEHDPRNLALLTLLYYAGVRVSEAVQLRWSDAVPRGDGVTLTIYGKGGKTRYVPLPAGAWSVIGAVRTSSQDGEIFAGLNRQGAYRIVKAAAIRAGLPGTVSPHWLRHAHATHAIERGCPIHLLQQTLGHASVATTSKYLHARPNDSSARFLGL